MSNYRNTLVCTVLSYPPEKLPREATWMLDSAARHGIEVVMLGGGEPWVSLYRAKMQRLYETLCRRTDYDYIVFVDGRDSLWATGLGELHAKFEKMGAAFVMSAEINCWPFRQYASPRPTARFKYLNSGFYMATWDAFLAVFKSVIDVPMPANQWMTKQIQQCDQSRFMYALGEKFIDIKLDHDCALSQTLYYVDTVTELTHERRPQNKLTGMHPCTFHANGRAFAALKHVRELVMR